MEVRGTKQGERQFIIECIYLYRDLPSLWNVKSKAYHDRDKKIAAYGILLSKYREMYPKATREDIRKKFNSLRTNFRKELKKHEDAMKSGAVFKPTLWYYDEMLFLKDQNPSSESQWNMERFPSAENSGEESGDVKYYVDVNYLEDNTSTNSDDQTPSTSFEIPIKNIKKRNNDQLLDVTSKRLRQESLALSDEYAIWALSCAADLKKMDPMQQIYAKNAISTILMEGQLGLLHRHSVKINEPKLEM